tara:strand:- start:3179 stop:3478 length:300 start_codon:yes stop_codon:yes gene_type:complete
MENIEENIQKTLNSLDSVEKPSLSPLMADRIWKIAISDSKIRLEETWDLRKKMVWLTGIATVVILNIAFLSWNSLENKKTNSSNEMSLTSLYFDSEIDY